MFWHRYPTMEVEDGMVWSKRTGPWVWMRVPAVHYDGLTLPEQVAVMRAYEAALATIGSGEAHALLVEVPSSSTRVRGASSPQWSGYAAGVEQWVIREQFTERVLFLGVRLNRLTVTALTAAVGRLFRVFGASDEQSRAAVDRNTYRTQGNQVMERMVAAGVFVRPATARELAQLVSRPAWMDIDRTATQPAGVMEGQHLNAVRIEHRVKRVRWVTTLIATHADFQPFPEGAWLLPNTDLRYRPEVSMRFDIVAADDEAKVLEQAHAATVDQVENITETGDSSDARVGLALQEQLITTRELAHQVRRERTPWVWPSISVTVTADTEEELDRRITAVIGSFRQVGLTLTCPATDQYRLLIEQVPGTPWAVRDWQQKWPLVTFAGAMPHATVRLGMDEGPYLGHTVFRDRCPVNLDVISLPRLGISPTVAIVGQPGSGKSASLKKLVYEARLRGAWVVYLDPAAETDPLVQLLAECGVVQVVELDSTYAGALDPWSMHANTADAAALAVDLSMIMLPNVHGTTTEITLTAIADQVSKQERPSMRRFVDALMACAEPDIARVGAALNTYARLGLASLFFGEYTGKTIRIEDAFTVLRWFGLDLAEPGTPDDGMTSRNRLSSAVLHGTSTLVRLLMQNADRDHEKLLVMDEVEQFTRTPAGRAETRKSSAMGRKHGLTLLMSGQNVSHLAVGDESLFNNVSVVFAFRSTDVAEQTAVTRLLRRGQLVGKDWVGDPAIMERLGSLGAQADSEHIRPGYCLLRDPFNRVGEVLIDHPNRALWDAVQTTPQGAQPAMSTGEGL